MPQHFHGLGLDGGACCRFGPKGWAPYPSCSTEVLERFRLFRPRSMRLPNPGPMAVWAATIALMLAIGSIPLFVGLAIVMPVLGHASWHLYRRAVVVDQGSRRAL